MITPTIKRFPDGRILAYSPVLAEQQQGPVTLELQRAAILDLLSTIPELRDRTLSRDAYGRPQLEGIVAGHFSLAHSGNCAGFYYDPLASTGMDIELIRPKVIRIIDKFLSKEERQDAMLENVPEKAIVYWCAKETLYKRYGKKEVHFKTDMSVAPFSYRNEGILKCRYNGAGFPGGEILIKYEKKGDYMISYIDR
jgi:4'-phosphopantetheinyl transferase